MTNARMDNNTGPERKWLRLATWDYTAPGAYFVTVCTHGRACLFGRVENGIMIGSAYAGVVEARWQRLPRHFDNAELDAFVVMPNHIHGIIVLSDPPQPCGRDEASRGGGEGVSPGQSLTPPRDASSLRPGHAAEPDSPHPARGTRPHSLGAIVQNLKSVCTRRINELQGTLGGRVWQLNYYERIIRNDRELEATRRYIGENPLAWEEDPENPERRPG